MSMTQDQFRLDSNESAFFNRQLEHIKTQTYDTKYKALRALTFVPVNTTASNGDDVITWRSFSQVGVAKIVSDYATDYPRVDVYGVEQTVKVKPLGDSFAYSIKEIRRSQRAGGIPLDVRRANAARRAIEELQDRIALFGDTATSLQGYLNYSGVTIYSIIADGTSSSKLWANKTPDQIVRDIQGIIDAVMVPTKAREIPDTLLLPLAKFNYISTTRMGTVSDITILQYILKTNPYLKRVDWLNELAGVGAGGTDRMMVGSFDAEHITFELPQPFEMTAPEAEGRAFKVACNAETGGIIIYYPQAFAYGDGF